MPSAGADARRCRTKDLRLDGAPTIAWERFEPTAVAELRSRYGLEEETARHLVHRYGTRASAVAEYAAQDAELRQRVVPGEPRRARGIRLSTRTRDGTDAGRPAAAAHAFGIISSGIVGQDDGRAARR